MHFKFSLQTSLQNCPISARLNFFKLSHRLLWVFIIICCAFKDAHNFQLLQRKDYRNLSIKALFLLAIVIMKRLDAHGGKSHHEA